MARLYGSARECSRTDPIAESLATRLRTGYLSGDGGACRRLREVQTVRRQAGMTRRENDMRIVVLATTEWPALGRAVPSCQGWPENCVASIGRMIPGSIREVQMCTAALGSIAGENALLGGEDRGGREPTTSLHSLAVIHRQPLVGKCLTGAPWRSLPASGRLATSCFGWQASPIRRQRWRSGRGRESARGCRVFPRRCSPPQG